MRSKAHISSHPLHPILIPFPIAFFTGTLLAHLGGWLLEEDGMLQTAFYLNAAGVLFAVAAAVPGLIDYVHTVPPNSSAKKRAARHGLINTTMLILFALAFFYRRSNDTNDVLLLALETIGLILMLIAGWMGGTLVYRNQIGVDHRFGNAGKWNEAHFKLGTGLVEVSTDRELKVNAMKLLHFRDKRIVLARTESGYAAFDDRCPHKGGSLAGGSIMCGTVQCPWHGSQFRVGDGSVTAGPSETGISTYPVTEKEGKIFLHLNSQ